MKMKWLTNSFIEQNLPHVAKENKLIVKKQLLTHYVLVYAIQDIIWEHQKKMKEIFLKESLKINV